MNLIFDIYNLAAGSNGLWQKISTNIGFIWILMHR
ncbi:hypothetical protein HDC91_003951 [Mucilaginibacter sp. AK015]|nr:hypothetical protein [Mucilaginibacter sp. AK015]